MCSRITILLNQLGLVRFNHGGKKSFLTLAMLTLSFPDLCAILGRSLSFYSPSKIIFRSPLTMDSPVNQ